MAPPTTMPPVQTGPSESRMIPPHGDVSPDGRHVWPRPSLTARVLVYGGVALAAAGATAGAVILARKAGCALSGCRDGDAGQTDAPRFAATDDTEREAIRRAIARREAEDAAWRDALRRRAAAEAAEVPAAAPARAPRRARRRPPPRDGLRIGDLTNALRDASGFVAAAVSGFASVARQGGLLDQFRNAADLLRGGATPEAPHTEGAAQGRAPFRHGQSDSNSDATRHDTGDSERLHRL